MTSVIKPNFKIKALEEKGDYGKFVLEPLEQGYGQTLGNGLRRCLLSSLPGASVTAIKIDGIKHQFSTIPGLKEDIVEFILNVKQIRVTLKGQEEVKATLDVKGSKEVKAGDIQLSLPASIINKDLVLATLSDKKAKLNCTLWFNTGYGYSPAEERKSTTLGVIPVDAVFTPVTRVNYKVEATRVGRRTDFDKLILEIWTNGTISSKLALEESAKILESYFRQVYKPVIVKEEKLEGKVEDSEVLRLTVEELNLPTRIANALRRSNYDTVKDLTKATRAEIAKVKNLGKKSIEIVVEKLKKKGVKIRG